MVRRVRLAGLVRGFLQLLWLIKWRLNPHGPSTASALSPRRLLHHFFFGWVFIFFTTFCHPFPPFPPTVPGYHFNLCVSFPAWRYECRKKVRALYKKKVAIMCCTCTCVELCFYFGAVVSILSALSCTALLRLPPPATQHHPLRCNLSA